MESGSVKRHVITAAILLGRHERRPSRLPRGEAHRTARTLPGVHARPRTGLCTSPQAKSDVTVALGHRKAAASGLRAVAVRQVGDDVAIAVALLADKPRTQCPVSKATFGSRHSRSWRLGTVIVALK